MCPRANRLEHVLRFVVHTQDEHARSRGGATNVADDFETRALRHRDVQHDDVRLDGSGQRYRFPSARGFAGDVEPVRRSEDVANAFTHDGVVIGHEDTDVGFGRHPATCS